MNKKQKGFSLIELLIVVAIILIIAAIAIPNLLRARIAANEASAVGSLRTIVTAEISYANSYQLGPAVTIGLLANAPGCVASSNTACLIDTTIATNKAKSGYTFDALGNGGAGTASQPNTGFEAIANPITPGTSGQRSFCADMSGVLHVDQSGAVMTTAAGACGAVPTVLQ